MQLATSQIEATSLTRVRHRLNQDTIQEYAQDIKDGAKFPPLICFAEQGSERFVLADGFHRLHAAIEAGKEVIEVEIREGGVIDAQRFALGANCTHGLRRSRADKRHAVEIAFRNPVFRKLSNREIADLCRVSHSFVNKMRDEQAAKDSDIGNVSKPEDEPQEVSDSDTDPKSNIRPTKAAPTQDDFDLRELIGALATIRSFPYDGAEAAIRLGLHNHVDNVEYCYQWLEAAAEKLAVNWDDLAASSRLERGGP